MEDKRGKRDERNIKTEVAIDLCSFLLFTLEFWFLFRYKTETPRGERLHRNNARYASRDKNSEKQ